MSRIEETWRLWAKFLDDYARFEDWLSGAEVTAARPDSADVLYTGAKEELKRFEVSPFDLQNARVRAPAVQMFGSWSFVVPGDLVDVSADLQAFSSPSS